MSLAISFTNFGPYHLARLRALARALGEQGRELIAYETADKEAKYAWSRAGEDEPFRWVTLFPGRTLESIPNAECRRAMREALRRDRPEAVAAVGYVRPESLAMLSHARTFGLPSILMSESQEIDHPRVWWKERIKRERVRRFDAGLVGGERHRAYLAKLGLQSERVCLGYNAVDNALFTRRADAARGDRRGLPDRPYFIAVNRFVPEKNLGRLIEAHALYRDRFGEHAWDLVLAGGGEEAEGLKSLTERLGVARCVHFPGFLQAEELPRLLANAGAFVHPSLMEPWGLVVNEAAACGLPLLVSDRAGAVETFVPEDGSTGFRIDPTSTESIRDALIRITEMPSERRAALGRAAFEIVSRWGPERFASGTLEALEIAESRRRSSRRRRVAAVS